MDLGAILRMVRALGVDAETRRALQQALDGEGGAEAEAALEALMRSMGIVDEAGEVDEERVRGLAEDAGLEV